MSSYEYLENAIRNVEEDLTKSGRPPLRVYGKKAGERPFPASYRPELDCTPELLGDDVTKYLQLVGVLRWSIELGRIDITTEVSTLSQHQCNPRVGHLDAIYRIFWYLKRNLKNGHQGRIVFDARIPDTDEKLFMCASPEYWEEFYPEAAEAIPVSYPKPRGKAVKMAAYVDADHAGNLATRRSHSGLLLFLNNTPILWYSKRQNTVESLSFGSEFIAMRIAVEVIEALRYKLRMFGVPIDGSCDLFCDNRSVVTNASIPTSMLNRKHNAICYHRVREAQAAGTIRVGWIKGEYNKADLLTKTTLSTKRWYDLLNSIFQDNCPVIERCGK